jgi:aminopeptidase N
VLTGRNPVNRDAGILFVTSDRPEALKGLSRKLPHYHKYSYLGFRGDEPENVMKGRWTVADSPMTVFLLGENRYLPRVEIGGLKRNKPLASISRESSSESMMKTVSFLAGDELKGRALGSQELDRAADYIAQKFREAGLRPSGDTPDSYFQTWEEKDHAGKQRVMKNIVGVIPGRKPEWSSQSIVVGAHYDHLGTAVSKEGKEQIYHGADDNASGVAAVTELARLFGESPAPDRSVIFVAFTGEESGRRGSKYFLDHLQGYPKEQIMGMLNLDTVGRLGNNKLLILGSGSAKEWEHIFKGIGFMTGVGIALVAEELDSSDQKGSRNSGRPVFFRAAP